MQTKPKLLPPGCSLAALVIFLLLIGSTAVHASRVLFLHEQKVTGHVSDPVSRAMRNQEGTSGFGSLGTHRDANGYDVYETEDFQPTDPGHSPGVGHSTGPGDKTPSP
ncbi:hypothetical protein MLD38_034445 [Melastoma candidum]|uniref:Uncharacterized protein n=1 Tax=Melastoma candidum TaxID=119954 RepID=A0ACB9MAJ1_9MYRT|nr:hypothetical protein MLD38_034445 [Melastoma candidum]